MTTPDRKPLYSAVLSAMRPLASMLLRFGIGYREFAEVCKSAFVQAAIDEFGIRGRPTNTSRVAAMTGLTRKEVRRIRDLGLLASLPPPETRNAPAEVLHVWHTDRRFSSAAGVPDALTWDTGPGSFMALVRSCAGDIPPGAIRAELRRVGALIEIDGGRLLARRRYYVPGDADQRLLQGVQFGLRPLALTVAHNAAEIPDDERYFQRVVQNRFVPVARRAEVERQIRERLAEFSEEIDDYFTEVESGPDRVEGALLGIGLFYYEDLGLDRPEANSSGTSS